MRTQRFITAALSAPSMLHQSWARLRTLACLVGVAVFLMAAVPLHAAADSCQPLLNGLAAFLKEPGSFVSVVPFAHTTNYQIRGYWQTAHAWGHLLVGTGGPILSGMAYRSWHDGWNEPPFAIEFYADGSVRFAGQYGPYPTTCDGNKFLTVYTGSSFETFSFNPYRD